MTVIAANSRVGSLRSRFQAMEFQFGQRPQQGRSSTFCDIGGINAQYFEVAKLENMLKPRVRDLCIVQIESPKASHAAQISQASIGDRGLTQLEKHKAQAGDLLQPLIRDFCGSSD